MICRQHHSIRCVGCVPGRQKGSLPLVQNNGERRRYGCVRAGRASFLVLAGEGQDLDELLQEDLKRMAAKEGNFAPNGVDDSTKGSSLKDIVDKILIADFFFVLFALGWFGAGVGIKSSSGDSGVLDAWLSLWQWIFQPAIGVLMLGALTSGTIGWIKKKME